MHVIPVGKQLHRAHGGEFLGFVIAYLELLCAYGEARDSRCPSRANPVPLSCFRNHGVLDHILIWMLYYGHVEHMGLSQNAHAHCAGAESLLLTPLSAFCLTEAGEAFANEFLADALLPLDVNGFNAAWDMLTVGLLLPSYDKNDRVFCWGRHVLKRFRQPAGSQELVLCAAEELEWPYWFDDPLPKRFGKSAKIRVHDTIKDLNRHQTPYLIHFKGDGTGTRFGWEYR